MLDPLFVNPMALWAQKGGTAMRQTKTLVTEIGFFILVFFLCALFLTPYVSAADKFPSKPVKIIITHGAGGSVDLPTRGIAPFLSKYLGVAVVCENMTGAGGRRAMDYVFNQAKPDGYTIVASAFPSRLIGELLYETKYKMKEFVPLGSWVGGGYRSIFVAKDSPFNTFQDLAEASKKRKLTGAGGGGLGSTGQLQFVYLKEVMGLDVEFVPYSSSSEVLAATLGGHVDFGTAPLSGALRDYKAGRTKLLAIHSQKRMEVAPDVPSLEELGYKGVVIGWSLGAWAPPQTPNDIAKILSDALMKAAKDPDFIAWAEKSSVLLEPLGPEEFYQVTLDAYENISKVLPLLKTAK
jgi:tripartite-type tricarboxylate transporter receptor subunit TctC